VHKRAWEKNGKETESRGKEKYFERLFLDCSDAVENNWEMLCKAAGSKCEKLWKINGFRE